MIGLAVFCGAASSLTASAAVPSIAVENAIDEEVRRAEPDLEALYRYLHEHPELSGYETATAKRLAAELRSLGYDVTEKVGKYRDPKRAGEGVVGVMVNGTGPTLLIRSDMDALPIEEKTGLPYASRVRAKGPTGEEVPVMHACGHDLHMASLIGTARVMSALKGSWNGRLILVAQPAEEDGLGAAAMLRDGLYARHGKPDYCLALHSDPTLRAGSIGWIEGNARANVDNIDIVIRGVGGHAAAPHAAKDPVVMAAEVILALQTILSRELAPGTPAAITVGSIHGGNKHNVIPDEVKLQLTVRSYDAWVRSRLLESIERITRGIAQSFGVPAGLEPVLDRRADESIPALYNTPSLVQRLVPVWERFVGKQNVSRRIPVMVGDDFAHFGLKDHSIPIFMFNLGVGDAARIEERRQGGTSPAVSLHTATFAPVFAASLRTAVGAMCRAAMDLMKK